jgi:hypothetical protein
MNWLEVTNKNPVVPFRVFCLNWSRSGLIEFVVHLFIDQFRLHSSPRPEDSADALVDATANCKLPVIETRGLICRRSGPMAKCKPTWVHLCRGDHAREEDAMPTLRL